MKSDVLQEYLKKYPNTPTLTLAKTIYNEHSDLFKSVEGARNAIRYHRGSMGAKNRKDVLNKQFVQDEPRPFNPFTLPASDADNWQPFHLPKSCSRILVLSDIHLPYHDVAALNASIEYGKEHNADTVLLNGDILDFYMISKYTKDPRKRNFNGELEMLRQFISYLKQELPGAKIYYKLGNHEERYENWMYVKAPELLGMADFKIETLIQSRAAGVEVIFDKRVIYAGKLPIVHGHEIQGSGTVNPARTLYLKTKESAVKGHSHITSENNGKTLSDGLITTWSTGCLCDLHPEYARINEWNHGFAFVKVTESGTFKVANLRILNGEVL